MMSYLDKYFLSESGQLRARVTACAAEIGVEHPEEWAYRHRWVLACWPGWADAHAAAVRPSDADEYWDASIAVDDGMIRTAVAALLESAAGGDSGEVV